MQDTIFTVELPLVEINEELEKAKGLYPQYDSYFIVSGCCKERREKFDKLWAKYKPYADRHFIQQAKISFHQRSWEMYMANVLLEKGFKISSQDEGPDFIVNDKIYLECIAPTKGDPGKPDSVPPMYVATKSSEIVAQDVPVDKMILRITQSLKDKALDQYEKWKNKQWFDEKKPFIIAINTGELEYPQVYLGIPLVIKALFGLQYLQISQNGEQSFSWRNKIDKGDGVPVTYFADDDFKFVSGVVFSDKTVLNHPEIIGEDCIFINNPHANYPVSEDFSKFKNWKAIKNKEDITLQKNY